jgi:predicted amidohydrolase YtcJ
MRRALAMLSLLVTVSTPAHAGKATLIYNGRILVDASAAPATRFAGAALVQDGRFIAVGTLAAIDQVARDRQLWPTRVDLHGGFAVPALTDAHGHVEGLGIALQRLRLEGTKSAAEIAGMVAKRVEQAPAGEWILGRGWDQNDWAVEKFPTRDVLDRVSGDHPVWLRRVDGHAAWANSKALELAGVTKATQDPPGGRIERVGDGTPAGVLVDNAMELVESKLPVATREQRTRAISLALQRCAELGLTSVHDAGIDEEAVSIYRELAEKGAMPVRVFAMLAAGSALASPDALPREKPSAGDGRFRLFAVKAYADGALGSRGAALLEPYSDDPGNRGLVRTPPDTLELLAKLCLERGYPLCVHAIGDRANRMVLDAMEHAAAAGGDPASLRERRFRIEHAQVISAEDLPRFAKLGVIASMQPTHCTSDMPWAGTRLGTARIEGAYAWRKLLDSGARLALGSDFPVEDPNPLWGIYAAVTTQDRNGHPPGGYRPSEKLTIWEALRGFTSDAAYAASAERELGLAEPGYRADLAVFDRDLTKVAPGEIPKARCVLTMVGGEIVWNGK